MRIMIADDETLVIKGLTMQFERLKPQWTVVGKATDGQMALGMLKEQEADVLITDIRMPVMDGMELARKAVSIHPRLQVIILSGYADFEYARDAIRFGARDYLLKPFDFMILINIMDKIQKETFGLVDEGSIEKVVKYLENHYSSPPLSLNDAAEIAGMSPAHLSRQFKKEVGESFITYLTRKRIEHAKRLLEECRYLKVYEIGESAGYPDKHYFATIFKRTVGMTPEQYRESKKCNHSSII